MSYPLVVIGAGASYDLMNEGHFPIEDHNTLRIWKPPLTNQLFDGHRFYAVLKKYPEMSNITSHITGKLGRVQSGATFESILTKLFNEGTKANPHLKKEIVALLYYLSDLFKQVSANYYRVHNNNYARLRHLLTQNGGKAVFVNFNYDLLLEKALEKHDIKDIQEFIKGEFPVIKIHGAYDWYWERKIYIEGVKPSYDLAVNNPDALFEVDPEKLKWRVVIDSLADPKSIEAQQTRLLSEGVAYHPALALPISNKNNFVCPESHIALLRTELAKIDRVIIVGWKVGDPFLRDMLVEEAGRRKLPIAYVGGEDSKQTVDELPEPIKNNIKFLSDTGFSDAVTSDEFEDFFGDLELNDTA